MNTDDIRRNAEKVIEKADRLIALTKKEGWADFVEILDILLSQEVKALAGQSLDHNYYKKIGFIQHTAFIKALPGIVQNKQVMEYLIHQGRGKAIETIKNIPFLYSKQKAAAQQQLQQILGNDPTMLETLKKQTAEETYKNS